MENKIKIFKKIKINMNYNIDNTYMTRSFIKENFLRLQLFLIDWFQ